MCGTSKATKLYQDKKKRFVAKPISLERDSSVRSRWTEMEKCVREREKKGESVLKRERERERERER